MMFPADLMASQCACHRMLELAVGRLELRRSAAAMLRNDTQRAAQRRLRAALGGSSYSLPPTAASATWRFVASGGALAPGWAC